MELKGSRTEEILKKSFGAELQASFRYRMIAEAARRENLNQVADIFEATAENELEHARHEFDFLGITGDIQGLVGQAIRGEADEASTAYPEASKIAGQEGFTEIADFFRRIGTVEARHEELFRKLLEQLQNSLKPTGRTVGNSAVDMARVMQPEQANPAGFIHGGELMKLMDDAAGVVAARHSGTSIVTGNVEDIKFLRPVRIGDLLLVHGKITFTSQSSMEVMIDVESEGIFSEHSRNRLPVLSALFVMVAVDKSGKALPVPQVICSTEEETRLFEEGQERYNARKLRPGQQ
jgi:acyl-CoA hydrolase/rubrerythrin